MQELMENIVIAAIGLAVLVWLGRSLFAAFGPGQADSSHFCTRACTSCQGCRDHQKLPIYKTGGERNQEGETPVSQEFKKCQSKLPEKGV